MAEPPESPTHAVAVPVSTVWTAPDAPREHHRLLAQQIPDVAGWCARLDNRQRLDLHGRTLTQALLGEPVVVDEVRDGWARVRLPWQPAAAGGYPGWMPTTHLTEPALPGGPAAVVRQPGALLHDRDGRSSVSLGTVLPLASDDENSGNADAVTVRLPGGGTGTLPRAAVWLQPDDPTGRGQTAGATAGAALETARLLTAAPYVWGGTCEWGVDCSGLVHLGYRVAGVVVPRDAADLHAALAAVAPEAAQPADLYFFARPGEPVHHVGFVTGPTDGSPRMLHAPETGGHVEEVALPPERLELLIGAGRLA